MKKGTLFIALVLLLAVLAAVFISRAATNPPPVVTNMMLLGSSNLELGAHGRLGKRFRFDTTDTLTDWTVWETVTPDSSNFSVVVSLQTNTATCFSRIMMLPSTNPPVWSWTLNYPLAFSPSDVTNLFLQWNPPTDLLDITGYRIYQNEILIAELAATTLIYEVSGLVTGELYSFRIEAGNEDDNWTTNGLALSVRPAPGDPTAMASVPGNGIPTSVGDSIRFLFDATNAIQTGADTNVLESYRLSVLRGRVLDAASNALEGVAILVQGEPDYGVTFTRTNGYYDLAVNGGGSMVLDFRRHDYLPVQRTVAVPWQEELSVADVFLLPPVTNTAVVNLTNSTSMQVARGAAVSDADGTRSAMVLVPTNAQASIITYAGETQAVGQLNTRFTEYTAGTIGPDAMPGDMLPSVAYTYCVELGSDEAQDKVAGRDVLFNTNVYFYTDNFIGIPPGISVPMGYYDNDSGAWVPSPDGIVIDLLGTNESGLARVCANTNGTESDAAELAALGFTDEERLTLAQTYSPTTNSLWRVPIQHFSTYDCNYGIVPEDGAEEPQVPTATGGEIIPTPQVNCGNSGIEVENQILTEWLPLPGTPYRLVYSSQTASSNPKFKKMRIPVSGDTIPANVSAIRLKMMVAGKPYQYDLPAETNQTVDFSWDGTDVYGRSVKGAQPVSYSVEYLYPGYYSMPPRMSASFGAASGEAIPGMISSRTPAVLRKRITSTVGSFDAASRGLGGWMLNVHHVYDPVNQRVYLGTGRTRDGVQLMTRSSESEWVTDVLRGSDNNSLDGPHGLDLGADGSVYVADSSNLRVARINRRGTVTTLSDMPTYLRNLAVGPKGYVYVTTTSYFGDLAVYRIAPNGQKAIFAGTGSLGPRITGVKATELHVDCQGIAFAPDGTAFIADKSSNVIWRIGTDGIANMAAGRLEAYGGYDGDGLPALESRLLYPYGVAYDENTGRLYICDSGNNRLRAITIGGYLLDIAGDGSTSASGDGGQAIDAGLWEVRSVVVGVDGSVFVVQRSTDPGGGRLRQILPDGRIITLAGEGKAMPGEGRLAKNCQFDRDWPISVGPDGSLYVTGDDCIYCFRPATRPIEAEADDTLLVASLDASQVYVFDLNGRHLRTLDALTGATNLSFSYTDDGFVESLTDLNGRTTQIHRDGDGFVTSIEAPGGQSVAFTLDGDYYIDSATYPDTGQYQMDYTNTLLSSFTRPRGFSSTYEYDDDGNLVKYMRPDGGTGVLSRASESSGWTVTHTNPIGVVQTYETELTDVGGQWTRVHYSCYCGPNFDKYTSPDGLSSNTDAEGVLTLTQTGSDPRFGVQAPYTAWSMLETPLGLQFAMTNQLTAGIPDSDAPQTFTALTNITVVNERTYVSIFDREARVQADTSPLGRVNITGLDGLGRMVYEQHGDQAGVTYGYDGRGYLSSITIGSGGVARVTSVAVDNHGNITNYTDPESRVTETDYDACNRLTNWTRASVVNVAYDRDLEGNRTLIRTPIGEAHTFTYTSENLLESYSTPAIGGVSNLTQWFYNGAGLVDFIGYPDGSSEEYIYDEAGRVQWRGYNNEGDYYSYGNIMGGSLLTRIESSNGVVVEYFYDGTLLLDEVWTGPVTGTVSRSYDNNLWVTGLTVNGAFTMPYRYDADGLITNIGELCISRDAQDGWITGTELGVVSDAYAYNVFGEVTNYSVLVDGSNLYQAALVRDGLGRITRETITDQGVTRTNTYTYDPAGRWLEAVTNGTTLRWSFDLNGNLTNFTRGGAVVASATYDAEDRLIQRGGDTYGYTTRGTLSTAVLSGVEYQYDYDLRGVLRGVSKSAGTVTGLTYVADGRGRRIARFANGTQTHGYLYSDELSLAAVLSPDNEVDAVLASAPGSSVPVYISITGRACRIITDLRGSPLFVVDTVSGEIAQQMTYSVWGEVQSDSHSLFQPIGYAGGLYEPETGWVRFGKRDYDAATGRWTAKDPALFVEWVPNLYRYCRNDPINMIDSSGAVPTGRIKGGPEDAHSLPDAPSVTGPAVTGPATVWVNNKPALRVKDPGAFGVPEGSDMWYVPCLKSYMLEDIVGSSGAIAAQASSIGAEAFVSGYTIGFTSDNQPICIINESGHVTSPTPTPAPATE